MKTEVKVFLSSSDVELWKADRARIVGEITEATAKIEALRADLNTLDKKMKAAILFVPDLEEWLDEETERQMGQEAVALTDAIKKVLAINILRPVPRDEIKLQLSKVGYSTEKLRANPNYFYIALKRLVERNEITEAKPGFFKNNPIVNKQK